jgi:hypothetical protein
MNDFLSYFSFGGYPYPLTTQQTLSGNEEKVGTGYTGFADGAFKSSAVVFACELVRVHHFSEARFAYRTMQKGRPGELFGDPSLEILEHPWPGGTTGDLLARMLLHADIGGNSFVVRDAEGVECLRPDWVTIVSASPNKDADMWDPAAEVVGYVYQPGGGGSKLDPIAYAPEQVAHFAPVPDPLARWRGMSWLTPVLRDIESDRGATAHKSKFFENGATPNLGVKLDIADPEKFKAWVDVFRQGYEGSDNAYKTMFLGAGADFTPLGSTFREIDFKVSQGMGETRIAAAAGTPPVIVGLSEGLQGSSLNEGNYTMARRRFADGTMRPLWRNVAGSLQRIVTPPYASAELWYDDRDIPFLQENVEDAAKLLNFQATAINSLVTAGYTPDSVVAAVNAGDLTLLEHTGLFSVQLSPPGTDTSAPSPDQIQGNGAGTPALTGT